MAQPISMTLIPPEGVLKLYSGIEIGGGRQKIFRTKAEQRAYFNDHLVMSFNDLSYIRMGDGIQIETDTVSIGQCNYLSFINKTSGVETEIYAQINPNWEYVNNNCVRISYAVDWWQTCMHSGLTMKDGLVVREHMCENDWTAATANPYADIFQLQTSEDLPMDQSMEKVAKAENGDVSIAPNLPLHQDGNGVRPEDMRLVLILGQNDLTKIEPDPDAPTFTMTYIISQITAAGGSVRHDEMIQEIPNACTIFVMNYVPAGTGPSGSIMLVKRLLNILEYNGLTGNIVGLYWIPQEYVNDPTQDYTRFQLTPVPYQYAPRNPKLYRAPYCYLRVSDETGQFKHYEWENFNDLIEGGVNVKFDIFFSQTGMPTLFAAPKNYKAVLASTLYPEEMLQTNLDEALVHADIPYLPFSTDGYLSALGSKMREAWTSNNPIKNIAANARNTNTRVDTTQIMNTGEVGFVDSFKLLPSAIGGIIQGVATGRTSISQMDNLIDKFQDKVVTARNKITDIAIGAGMNLQKATVADNYSQGSTKGWAGYMRAPLRFIFQKICPRADIVEQYDKYFDYFGYSSGRIGLPYVYNYITGTGDQPHFATIDNEQVTYCQANVSCYTNGKAPDIAARAIEAMFAQGVLFTK